MQDINHDSFDINASAVQNTMVGNINAKMIPNQLRPLARQLAADGEMPFALVTASQQMMANVRAQGLPGVVVMAPAAYAFNAQAARRHRQF